ncbi:MAG: hypothetical protein QY331_06490 [Melioribacteraceae bacterium]|nr:hypothetical protein [Melioribacteraceae bacterium]WKZ70896.1 MAG: hypothetical protein QY331_06490 [Melioribacteraceae bacterium]
MKLSKIVLIMMLFSMFLLISCNKEDGSPTEPEDGGGSGNTNASGQPMPDFGGNSDGVLATINYEFQTMPGFPAAQLSMAFAQFGTGIDGGNVSVNGNSLGKTSQGSTTFYMTPSPSNPTQTLTGVSFDGSNHNWQVSGNGSVPQMSGGVQSPSNFSLTGPANNATVSKSGGINITWSNASNNSNVLVVLAALDNSGSYYAAEGLSDNGSYTIPAGDISGISGQAMLQVVKYNYAPVSAGGKTYYAVAEVVKSVTITVN